MRKFTHCPMPAKGGADCWNESHPASTFGLCVEHWRKAVDQWYGEQPAINIRCAQCNTVTAIDSVDIPYARCGYCNFPIGDLEASLELIDAEAATARRERDSNGVVYYIRFADRVKIGFTTSLKSRVLALPVDEVLAAEPGSYEIEGQRHKQFAADLAAGREWFNLSEALKVHAASVRDRHGDPFAVKWGSE